jgi:hypothetical protein
MLRVDDSRGDDRYRLLRPTVNDTATLRAAISVSTSFGDGTLVVVVAGATAVIAWLLP